MSDFEPKPPELLLLAINTENFDEVEKLLKSPENKQLPESFMAAAEITHNGEIVDCVLDQILNNGLDIDHDFPTLLHWALTKGFRMTAANIASMITDEVQISKLLALRRTQAVLSEQTTIFRAFRFLPTRSISLGQKMLLTILKPYRPSR